MMDLKDSGQAIGLYCTYMLYGNHDQATNMEVLHVILVSNTHDYYWKETSSRRRKAVSSG
jgi:hypothetical protein